MKGVIVAAKKKVVLNERSTAACKVVEKLNGMKDGFTTPTNVTEHVVAVQADVSSTLQKVSAAKGDTQERFHALLSDGSMRDGTKQRSDGDGHASSALKKHERVEDELGGAAEDEGLEFVTDFEIVGSGRLDVKSAMMGLGASEED
ncbi:hypothetical protein ERJ75_001806000 [Trypanosoma vivax]|nr:hypothetical protein ERJ75_001806000 [Trypanosoma vivax]